MTTKPELNLGGHLLPGVAAALLFGVLAAVVIGAPFPEPTGFDGDPNITASIGYAMFNLGGGDVAAEGFLVAFEVVGVVLVAALAGAVLLARRDRDRPMASLATDGGRALGRAASGATDERADETETTETPAGDGTRDEPAGGAG